MLNIHKKPHGLELGFGIFEPILMFQLELLDTLFELCLISTNLFRDQIGTILQVATDITHRLSPLNIPSLH